MAIMIGLVDIVAVLIAAVASMVLGAFWYSPAGFGKKWMKLAGISDKNIEKHKGDMWKFYLTTFISAVITAYVIAALLKVTGAQSILEATGVAIFVWLGFVATTTLGSVIWEQRPFELYLLNNSFTVVNYIIVTLILVLWP